MISTAGMSANLALSLINRKRETFEDSVQKEPVNAREISAFRERIGNIQSVEDLVNDYEVYSFVMKAYDLESQIFGKGMMKKVLSSDIDEKGALVNKLTDTRFKDLYKAMGFENGGTTNSNTSDPEWIEQMVDRYVDQKLINGQLEGNEIVGNALHAQAKAPGLTSWYTVLADTKLQSFFYTALGLSDELKTADIDKQVATLKKKFDISTLSEPGVLEKLERKYVAIAQANASAADESSNSILQLIGGASTSTERSIIEISLDGLNTLRKGSY